MPFDVVAAVADDCFGVAEAEEEEEVERKLMAEEVLLDDAVVADAAAELETAPEIDVAVTAVAVALVPEDVADEAAAVVVLAFFLMSVRESPMAPSAPWTNSHVATEAFLKVSLLKP